MMVQITPEKDGKKIFDAIEIDSLQKLHQKAPSYRAERFAPP